MTLAARFTVNDRRVVEFTPAGTAVPHASTSTGTVAS
jgi:hypothetical protein